jgi:hypothetical protein
MGNFSGIKTAPKIKLSDFRKEGSEMMQGQDLVASKPDDRWGRSISFVFLGRESEIGRKRLTPNVNPPGERRSLLPVARLTSLSTLNAVCSEEE